MSKHTLNIPAVLTDYQIHRLAGTMLRENPRLTLRGPEKKALARERLMAELYRLIEARWPHSPEMAEAVGLPTEEAPQ